MIHVARSILSTNLGLRKSERYLYFTDSNSLFEEQNEPGIVERRRFLHEFFEAFGSLGTEYPQASSDKYESLRLDGAEPRENVWLLAFGEAMYRRMVADDFFWKLRAGVEFRDSDWAYVSELLEVHREDAVSAVIAFPWYSTTHTRFRKLLTLAGTRYVSMPQFTPSVMRGPLMANLDGLAARTARVAELLEQCESLRITCPKGTALEVRIWDRERVHRDSGRFATPGAYGNLPAGEAYFVPEPGSANGLVVLTCYPGVAVSEPFSLRVRNGELVDWSGDSPYVRTLTDLVARDYRMAHIAEIGIGTNPAAKDIGSEIEGEKICGTAHVALGDDSSIGGSWEASEHLDYIIQEPTATAILRGGKRHVLLKAGQLTLE